MLGETDGGGRMGFLKWTDGVVGLRREMGLGRIGDEASSSRAKLTLRVLWCEGVRSCEELRMR